MIDRNHLKRGKTQIVETENKGKQLQVVDAEKIFWDTVRFYDQRHVLRLKAVADWKDDDIKIQKEHNRILQKGYSFLEPDEIIRIANVTNTGWLTDFVCPNVHYACKLNIAADLVTRFEVASEELNDNTRKMFDYLISHYPTLLEKVGSSIDKKLNDLVTMEVIKKKALTALQMQYLHLSPSESGLFLNDFIKVETEKTKKQITHQVLGEVLDGLYPEIAKALELTFKTLYPKGSNVDFSFLGAPGSGKSTVAKRFLTDDRKKYVVLATDDYRGVVLEDAHELLETDQVFARTQDTAYSIKELVQQRLESNSQERPNIILDCVSLEWWHRKLLSENKETISVMACLNDISMVPERIFRRAKDPNAGPGDYGRIVNTSDLLKGHSTASSRLLLSIPTAVQTKLLDTTVDRGSEPRLIATIDTRNKKHDIDISDLAGFSAFLCKANVNEEATFKGELYCDTKKKMYRFTFDSHYKAEQVLNLVKAFPLLNKPDNYNLTLSESEKSKSYAQITVDDKNQLQFKVLDRNIFLDILNKNGDDTRILLSIIMQVFWKSLDEVRKKIRELGRFGAEFNALQNMVSEIKMVTPTERSMGQKKFFREKTIAELAFKGHSAPDVNKPGLFKIYKLRSAIDLNRTDCAINPFQKI